MKIEAVISTLAAIVVSIIIAILKYRVARINRFNDAASTFRQSFSDAINDLRSGSNSDALVLEAEFPSHRKAKEVFEPILSGSAQVKFDAAWDHYEKHYENKVNGGTYTRHVVAIYTPSNFQNHLTNTHTIHLINDLLRFARNKKLCVYF
ncbi:MAG: hypothetical protein ACOYOS_16700 [Syntrophales bacterium]